MTTVLDQIISYKREEVAAARRIRPEASVLDAARAASPPRGFARSLREAAATGPALIAEIKKASPSKGLIRADFDPPAHARAYADGGAACLSVLTDGPSFMGDPDYLIAARAAVSLPVLRKDFMIDPYQVAEARAWGADAILIIMACTDDALARDLADTARDLGMDPLIEVHDAHEMARALALDCDLIGVNNRDLRTFKTDLGVTAQLAGEVPPGGFLIAESGIATPEDIATLTASGARGFLVGETLMRASDIAAATRALIRPSD